MKVHRYGIGIIALFCTLFTACNSEPTLQKYFVENSEKKDFTIIDISPSILNIDTKKLTADQRQAYESLDKMNVLAFKADESNKASYDAEKAKVKEILKDEKYQQLMKFSDGKDGASVSFVGDENHIDEFVLFANKKDTGFAVIRVLGTDMTPTGIFTMMAMLKQAKIDPEQLKPLQELMAQNK